MQPIVLPRDWAAGRGPLHRRLAAAVDRLIANGELADGSVLPTERDLAALAGVSRATAGGAYRLLKESGRVQSRQGRGTWVSGSVRAPHPSAEGIAPVLVHPDDVIDLSLAAAAPEPSLVEVLAAATETAGRAISGVGYEPAGPASLRERIGRGRPERVLVTSGAQQGLSLLVDELVSPGDTVVVENVTYVGILDAARRAGARLVSVPTGSDGVDVDALVVAVRRHRPSLVYLAPTHHSPTGSVLDDAARHAVVELALATGTPVVDDRTLAELAFDGARRPRPLASFDPVAPVLTVGSLSKSVWPGLRVGWVDADPSMIERLTARRMVDDLGGSVLSTAVSVEIWDDVPELTRLRASALASRHRHLVDRLTLALSEWHVAPSSGGTSAWVELPRGDATTFARTAAEHGVHLVPGPALSAHGAAPNHVRLSITPPETVLDAAVDRLAAAWSGYQEPPGRGPTLLV